MCTRNWRNGIVFYLCWILLTIAVGIICLPALISTRLTWRVADLWCDATLYLLRVVCDVIVPDITLWQPHIKLYAASHQSTLDTLILWRALKHPAFILKRELLWIPVFGWYLWRTRPVAINRTSPRAMEAMLSQARLRFAEGRVLIIFPQGTRSAPERRMPVKKGIAVLSHKLAEAVLPITLSTHAHWPKGRIAKQAGQVAINVHPVMSDCSSELKAWLRQLEAYIVGSA